MTTKHDTARAYTERMVEKTVLLADISPHPQNPKIHPDTQIQQLAASHSTLGQFEPVILWSQPDGKYIQVKGHGYAEGVKVTHDASVKAWILPEDTPPAFVRQIMLASNLHAMNSYDDTGLLSKLLQEQQELGIDLAALGTSEEDLQALLDELESEHEDAYIEGAGNEEEDTLPEQIEARCTLGQVWQLGKHFIICADAFDPITYKKLLSDIQPQAIITDPPYGMRLDADYSGMVNKPQFVQDKGVKSGRKYTNVVGDHEDFNASTIAGHFTQVQEQFWFGADYYASTLDNTMHSGAWLVWDKRLDESADKMFGSCFELIWSKQKHKRDILRHKWAGIFGTEHEPQRGRQHPTQKPVRLLEDIITRYTDEGHIILDPFLGSGTTLISAQRTGRICYGCELSPAYCDVVISRWEAETNQTARLLERSEEAAHAL